MYIDSDRLAEMRPCRFDRRFPALDMAKLVDPGVPSLGRGDGVSIVAFYDPNCSVCQTHFPEFLRLAERFKERANFRAVPRALWDKSLRQIAALKLAEPTGKYYEVWQKMLGRSDENGMSMEQITDLFRDVGLSTENFEQRLEKAKPTVIAERDRLRAAGIMTLPAIEIDGHKVASLNCSEKCMASLVELRIEIGDKIRTAK